VTLAIGHRVADSADVLSLARMNQQLIEDELHRNPMNLAELGKHVASMLGEDYTATLFEWKS